MIQVKLLVSLGLAVAGFAFGIAQKWLDALPVNELPTWLQGLDIANYFGRLGVWILLGTVLAVYARTPWRAAINTSLFLLAMIAGYYLYTKRLYGFVPLRYMTIWIVAACISFFLAYLIWYAKGQGPVAIALSSAILGASFSQAVLLLQGIRITKPIELATWALLVLVLRRKGRAFALQMGLSLLFALLYQLVLPHVG